MIIAFDLDDTLFREIDYVESGLRAVALEVAKKYAITEHGAFSILAQNTSIHDRGHQIDDLLRALDDFSVRRRNELIQVYRRHTPAIKLPLSSRKVLEVLRELGHRLFVVTDGNHRVQNRKVEALGLRTLVEHVYLTSRYGADATKPSTKVFSLMLKRTRANASDLIYVGDNPRKDFVGVRSLGGATIRVLTGGFKSEEALPGFDADLIVPSITEVPAAVEQLKQKDRLISGQR